MLNKLILEYVFVRNIPLEVKPQFDLWLKTYGGEFAYWAVNHETVIPYAVYQSFCRYQDDKDLLEKLQQVLELYKNLPDKDR